MADKVLTTRQVNPLIRVIRNFLLGREHTIKSSSLRYAPVVSKRTQPDPNLPGGSADLLSANYYYTRDGRREVKPPTLLAEGSNKKQLADGSKAATTTLKKPVTPGKYWDWD